MLAGGAVAMMGESFLRKCLLFNHTGGNLKSSRSDIMNTETNNVAATILKQMGGTSRLSAMTGAKNFINHGDAASFRFARPRHAKGLSNHVKITLNSMDLYDVQFNSLHGYNCKPGKSFEGVCATQLKAVFESVTGLYLTL